MPKKTTAPKLTFVLMDPARQIEIRTETEKLAKEVAAVKIETAEQCVAAVATLAKIQKLRRATDKAYKDVKAPITKAKRELDGAHSADVQALEKLEKSIEKMVIDFRRAEEARRAAKAAAEMAAREAAAKAEQEQRAAELRLAAASAPKSVAKLLKQQAEIIEHARPAIDPVQSDEDEVETLAAGSHSRKRFHGSVHNFEKLVLQVAAQLMVTKYGAPAAIAGWLTQFGPNPQASLECLTPKMPTINDLANRLRDDLQLEGVTADADESIITK